MIFQFVKAISAKSIGVLGTLSAFLAIGHFGGEEDLGNYSVLISMLLIHSVIARIGIESTIAKKVTLWQLADLKGFISNYFIFSHILILLTSLVSYFFIYCWLSLKDTFFAVNDGNFLLYCIANFFTSLIFINSAFQKSFGNVALANMLEFGFVNAIIACCIYILFYSHINIEFITLLTASIIFSYLISLTFLLTSKNLNSFLYRRLRLVQLKRFLIISWPTARTFWLASTLNYFNTWGGVLILTHFSTINAVAHFSVSQKIASVIAVIFTVSLSYVPHNYIKTLKKKGKKAANIQLKKYNLLFLSVSLLSTLIIYIFSVPIMKAFGLINLDPTILYLFLFAYLFKSAVGPLGFILNISGFHNVMLIANIATFTITISLGIILTAYFSGVGLAISNVINILFFSLYCLLLMKNKFNYRIL